MKLDYERLKRVDCVAADVPAGFRLCDVGYETDELSRTVKCLPLHL